MVGPAGFKVGGRLKLGLTLQREGETVEVDLSEGGNKPEVASTPLTSTKDLPIVPHGVRVGNRSRVGRFRDVFGAGYQKGSESPSPGQGRWGGDRWGGEKSARGTKVPQKW